MPEVTLIYCGSVILYTSTTHTCAKSTHILVFISVQEKELIEKYRMMEFYYRDD